ncbi:MAG: hypothetical protein WCG78_01895 [Candidatus Omnitrophota bacterium]
MGIWRKARASMKSAVVIALCHVGLACFFWSRGQYFNAYYWIAALMGVLLIPYLYAIVVKKTFIPYEAVYLYLGAFLSNYTGSAFLAVDQITYPPDVWEAVMKMVTAGAVSFLAGYWINPGKGLARALPLKNYIFPEERLPELPVKLYCIGGGLRIFFALNPTLAQFTGWQIIGIVMNYSISMGLMIDTYLAFSPRTPEGGLGPRERRKHLMRAAVILPLEMLYGVLAGFSSMVLAPIALVCVAYIKATKKIPVVTIAIVVLLFATFVIPFTKTFRSYYWAGSDIKVSLHNTLEDLSNKDRMEDQRTVAVGRIGNSVQLAVTCYQKKEEGVMVKTYASLFDYLCQFIPRFMWPNRPSVNYNRVGKELGLLNPDDNTTSCGLTLIAAFIINNGFIGVVIGMFFVGALIRFLWEWLMVRSGENLMTFLIYFQLLKVWVFEDQEFFVALHATIAFVLYTYFMLGFINKKKLKKAAR